jgi:hypothetical protein
MTDVVIQVEHLSKLYRIGRAQQRHHTLRDAISDFGLRIANLARRNSSSSHSAIRNQTMQGTDHCGRLPTITAVGPGLQFP